MPAVRLPEPIKERINRQPERGRPRFMSFNKTTAMLIEEALIARRALLKSGAKMPRRTKP